VLRYAFIDECVVLIIRMSFLASSLMLRFLLVLMLVRATRFLPLLSARMVNPRNSDSLFRKFTICDFSGEISSPKWSFRYSLTAWYHFWAVFPSLHKILKSSA